MCAADVQLLALDLSATSSLSLLARIVPVRINARPPFFCAFHALAVDDGGGRTGLPLRSFATLLVKRVVNSFQCAVIGPQIEVVVDRAIETAGHKSQADCLASIELSVRRKNCPCFL